MNELLVYGLIAFSFISFSFNLYFLSKKRQRKDSVELQEFLHDLTRSGGLVLVKRVAAEDVLIRQRRV